MTEIDPFSPDPAHRAELASMARRSRNSRRYLEAAPARYRPASLASVQDVHGDAVWRPLVQLAGRWNRGEGGPGLVLVGPPGTGKTWAAWAVLRSLCSRGEVLGGSLATILEALRPNDDDEAGRRAAWHRLLADAGVLLDDVGSEKLTEWAAATLDSIVDARWLAGHPTIVTSNLPVEDLRDRVGGRAWSRLTGDGCLVIRLTGADLRKEPR